ncbi:MAG: DHH family phosphoesterase [Thermodesulfobacteriota bacterium]
MIEVLKQVSQAIRDNERFLVASHMNPDGDALGSSIGLALLLESMGKEVVVHNQGPVPALYRFLPGIERAKETLDQGSDFEVSFVLDCCTAQRVGEAFSGLRGKGQVVVVDHHPPRQPLDGIHLIRTQAASTAELIYEIAEHMGIPVSSEAATALYAGLMTDTGSFRFSNTTPRALEVASRLLASGAQHKLLVEKVYESFPAERFRLLGMALGTLRFSHGGQVALLWVTRSMFQEAGADDEMTDGFVDIPRSIRGVEVAVLLREKGDSEHRINLRSRGRVDVGEVAARLGGGGHPNAAGCTLKGPSREVEGTVLRALEEALG